MAQMRQGLPVYKDVGEEQNRPYYLALLAEVYGNMGQTQEGLEMLGEALRAAHSNGEEALKAQ